eukprot:tig00021463_g21634.t1
MTLSALSTPKGVKYECEVCGRQAMVQCQMCRVTYYCNKDHQRLDWEGIHEKICQLLIPLRTPPLIIGSEEERIRRQISIQMHQRAMIEMTRAESIKFLAHEKFELAIPAAIQALRLSVDVYGAGAIELVPAYLLLAEANLGLQRYKQAEEYLSLANWSIVKNPDCSHAVRSQLHRNFGKLYASQGKGDDALKQLAHDVYYSSLMFGPEHVVTAGGLFQMAQVFMQQERSEEGHAVFDKVHSVWHRHVHALLNPATVAPDAAPAEPLSESQVTEGIEMLNKIQKVREDTMGTEHATVGEIAYTVGLLWEYMGDKERALELYSRALRIYQEQLGLEAAQTLDLRRAITRLTGQDPIARQAMSGGILG